jgi:hypothetical protein
MAFRYSFRKYQRLILGHLEQQTATRSGIADTISWSSRVGEDDDRPRALIRRFGGPAVVLAPTTTIQQQWRDEVWR